MITGILPSGGDSEPPGTEFLVETGDSLNVDNRLKHGPGDV